MFCPNLRQMLREFQALAPSKCRKTIAVKQWDDQPLRADQVSAVGKADLQPPRRAGDTKSHAQASRRRFQ